MTKTVQTKNTRAFVTLALALLAAACLAPHARPQARREKSGVYFVVSEAARRVDVYVGGAINLTAYHF